MRLTLATRCNSGHTIVIGPQIYTLQMHNVVSTVCWCGSSTILVPLKETDVETNIQEATESDKV